jgi:hypothetical protein
MSRTLRITSQTRCAAATLVSGATNSSGQSTVAGNDDREPGGHHAREGIGWKQESPTVAAPPHRL